MQKMAHFRLLGVLAVAVALVAVFLNVAQAANQDDALAGYVSAGKLDPGLYDRLSRDETAEALVVLDASAIFGQSAARIAAAGLGEADSAELARVSQALEAVKASAFARASSVSTLQEYNALPVRHVRVPGRNAAVSLLAMPGTSLRENRAYQASLTQSLALINQPQAATGGKTGAGTAVAVLDTGLDYTRAAFGSCTAPGVPASCRVPFVQDFAPNDGALDQGSFHGTNVAGIVAGVAPGAKVIGLDVFNGGSGWSSDIIAAMNWVVNNRQAYNIVAINLSLGDSQHVPTCNGSWAAASFTSLRNAGVIPVVAAGNGAWNDGLSDPACAPGALSVGAVYDSNVGGVAFSNCSDASTFADKATCFSQSAATLGMYAPGGAITAAGITMYGTSQAAPHVAGAVAVLAAAMPGSSVASRESALKNSGPNVTKAGVTKKRLDLCAALVALGSSCTGGGGGGTTPSISSLSPSSVTAGSPGFTLTVNGANFQAGASVLFAGTPRTTTLVNSAQVRASISAADVASAGTRNVQVSNPGSVLSNAVTFTITSSGGGGGGGTAPTLTSLSPTSAAAGSSSVFLIVYGSGFQSGAVMSFNGVAQTTYVGSGYVYASIGSTNLAAGGAKPVTVTNPGSGASNALTFTVTGGGGGGGGAGAPTLTSMNPTSTNAGGGAFTMTLYGSNFQAGATVTFGGVSRGANVMGTTVLQVGITAADVATAGSKSVTVTNPGGGTSNSLAFTVAASGGGGGTAPTITYISPSSATRGGAGFTMYVVGSGFQSTSVVKINGVNHNVTFWGSTMIAVQVTAADIATSGAKSVVVTNVNGATSAPKTLTVY